MRTIAILCLAVLVTGCESREKKVVRLRKEMDEKCGFSSAMGEAGSAEERAQRKAACDVATRDFNGFMNSR